MVTEGESKERWADDLGVDPQVRGRPPDAQPHTPPSAVMTYGPPPSAPYLGPCPRTSQCRKASTVRQAFLLRARGQPASHISNPQC